MSIELSAPSYSGYRQEFETEDAARDKAAELLGVPFGEMIEVASADGEITYCYATQEEADADQDGAYAVQYKELMG